MKRDITPIFAGPSGNGKVWQVRPHPRLLKLGVRLYRGYRMDLQQLRRRLEVPEGHVTLVLGIKMNLRIGDVGQDLAKARSYTSLISGLRIRPKVIEYDGYMCALEVVLAPWALYAISGGIPMDQLAEKVLEPCDLDKFLESCNFDSRFDGRLFSSRVHGLIGKIADQSNWAERFELLDEELLKWAKHGKFCSPFVGRAWSHLVHSSGDIRIDDLADRLSCSEGHLRDCFREQIGLLPKQVAMLMRMRCALRMIDNRKLDRVATDAGFSHQSHFNGEFKKMMGYTPGEFLACYKAPIAESLPCHRLGGQLTSVVLDVEVS